MRWSRQTLAPSLGSGTPRRSSRAMRRGRHAERRARRPNAFARVRAVLAGAIVLGVGATVTIAAWTDQEHAQSEISAGTFSIESSVDGVQWRDHSAADPAVLPLDATGLYPGQSRAAWISIRSAAGSVPGTVALDDVSLASAPDPDVNPNRALAEALTVRIATVTGPGSCQATLTDGELLTGIDTLPSTTVEAALPSSASVATFCVIVTLPSESPNAAQGGQVKPTWEFVGSTEG